MEVFILALMDEDHVLWLGTLWVLAWNAVVGWA